MRRFLRQKLTLEEVEAKIARLQAKNDNGFGESFPLGCGRGGRQRKSSKTINRTIDASIARAGEIVRLCALRDRMKAPPVPERRVITREEKHAFAVRWFDSLKVGDTYQPGNNPLPIIKKTLNALFTEGCRWSIKELTGATPTEAEQIRASFVQSEEVPTAETEADPSIKI